MKRTLAMVGLLLAGGCSSSSSGGSPGGGEDGSANDSSTDGTAMPETSNTPDSPAETSSTSDASDAGGGGDADASSPDGSCPASWLSAPVVAALMPDSGMVILHALGSGTQDYACIGTPIIPDGGLDGGDAGETFKWTLTGPDAVLSDCHGTTIGHHMPSEGGASAPEWLTVGDTTYVIGKKIITYDAGPTTSVAWLLLQAVDSGGAGTLSQTTFIERLDTDGGLAPATGCDFSSAGATTNVPYTADYYFWGP